MARPKSKPRKPEFEKDEPVQKPEDLLLTFFRLFAQLFERGWIVRRGRGTKPQAIVLKAPADSRFVTLSGKVIDSFSPLSAVSAARGGPVVEINRSYDVIRFLKYSIKLPYSLAWSILDEGSGTSCGEIRRNLRRIAGLKEEQTETSGAPA